MRQKTSFFSGRTFFPTCIAAMLLFAFSKSAPGNAPTDAGYRSMPPNSTVVVQDTCFREGRTLISGSDCFGCHAVDKEVAAPSYLDIAFKYRADRNAVFKLTDAIVFGGTGVWGQLEMPAHPGLLKEDVHKMVQYILHLQHCKTYNPKAK